VSLLATAGAILTGRVYADHELPETEVRRQVLELLFSGLGTRRDRT